MLPQQQFYYFPDETIELAKQWLDNIHQHFPTDSEGFLYLIDHFSLLYTFLTYTAHPDTFILDQKTGGAEKMRNTIINWAYAPDGSKELILHRDVPDKINMMIIETMQNCKTTNHNQLGKDDDLPPFDDAEFL